MSSKRDGWCRPLLRESKEEICSFASKEQIWWTEDPSNSKSIRGSLRAIFPLLDGIHGASIPAIARSARLLSEDAALLEQYTKEAWSRVRSQRGLNTEKWKQEPAAMQRRLLKNLCLIHEIPIRASILSQFQKRPTRVQLPGGGWLMTMEGDIVVCPATP
jgi:tRNA(Ile)-lysidine synthase